MIEKQITIDLWKQLREPITAVQYESDARKLTIYLTSSGLPVNVTAAAVVFYAKKPDGTIIYNACEIVDGAAGKVSYVFTEQTCAAAGPLRCWIDIVATGTHVRSQEFAVTVQSSEDSTDAIESTSEFTALEVALALVSGHEMRITAAEDNIDTLQSDLNAAETSITALQAVDNTGWVPITGELAYVSATSLTLVGDYSAIGVSKIEKGDSFKWTQNSIAKESNIIADPIYSAETGLTTVTIHAGYITTAADCAVLNTGIYPATNVAFSKTRGPRWFNHIPVLTGFSADPTNIKTRFNIHGSMCSLIHFEDVNGTSNATTFTVSLPVAAASTASTVWVQNGYGVDNAANIATSKTRISPSNAVAEVFLNPGIAVWTATGGKRASFQIFYEI